MAEKDSVVTGQGVRIVARGQKADKNRWFLYGKLGDKTKTLLDSHAAGSRELQPFKRVKVSPYPVLGFCEFCRSGI